MTCYDLRFPELARALVDRGAEVLVVPAAWVAGPRKVDHWRTLVRARAIENTVYVVAAGQPARATPATRWWSTRSATCSPRPATGGEGSPRPSTGTCSRRPGRTNPSLANRRM